VHDRLNHALRRWEAIRPAAGQSISQRSSEFADWLDRDVCPVVDELLKRPDFRAPARWSIDNLLTGSHTEPRRLIETTETALIETATDMAEVLRQPSVRRAIQNSARRGSAADARQAEPDYARFLSTLDFVASRPWRDLASVYDYFGPSAELNLVNRERYLGPDSNHLQLADFMRYAQPTLGLPGDFVFRCVEIRVEHWRRLLQRLFVQADGMLSGGLAGKKQGLRHAMHDVGTPLRLLRGICHDSAEALKRTACVTLVQVYAGFRPMADLTWLGEAAAMSEHADLFRWRAVEGRDIYISEVVAAALLDCSELYRQKVDLEILIEEKVRSHSLCVIEGRSRHEAYWVGKLLEVDWDRHGRAWTLLTALVEDAKQAETGVDRASDLGVSLRDARRDLQRLLPADFAEFLTLKNTVHRLQLPAAEIFFARFESVDTLEEVQGKATSANRNLVHDER